MHVSIRLTFLFGYLLLHGTAVQAERYTIPLLVSPTTTGAPQGMVRILNATDESGAVEIYAIGNTGARTGPAIFTLNASAAAQFTATDLQSGNAALGLTGGIGTGVGDARLEIETDLSIVPQAFVRAADGTLSAMHDTVRGASVVGLDGYIYEVPIFNPSSDVTQVSRLRLINPGDAEAAVTISGRDDSGAAATGGDVTLTLAAGGAQTLTAQQLEAGDTAVTGRLGAGTGKWRLTVASDHPLQVINIVAAAAGYWNNLSTTAAPGAAPADLESLNERFVGNAVVYVSRRDRYTLNAQTGERFSETVEIDGITTTSIGTYGYARIGPDAGRLTLSYDDGEECASNLYFSTRTGGGFFSRCTGGDYPAEGIWLGGNWFVESDGDDDGGNGDTGTVSPGTDAGGSLGVCQVGMTLMPGQSCTYPGTTDAFSVNPRGRGSFLTFLAGIRIRINNQTINGRVYDFLASHVGDGVWRIDRIAGSTEPTGGGAPGTGGGGADTSPGFAAGSGPGDRSYTVGRAMDTLTLPEATGGNGTLTYSLSPDVPGLSFNAAARQLSGTPAAAGTYAMTYAATDEDGDTDTLSFAIVVIDDDEVQVLQDFGDVRTVEVTPPGLVHVSVVDGRGFEPETHGQRITDTFLDNTGCASLDQLWGQREFLVNGVAVGSLNVSGIVRHTLEDDSGIFWTATDDSPLYETGRSNPQFFLAEGRPFYIQARLGAEWIRNHDTLVISSLENFTGELTGNGFETRPVYCDEFDPEFFIPLCGALDDYIAHTGVGMEKTIFVGGIDRFGYAQAAIRPDGVFAPNTIYVESPDGSTSHATPVLAAYAANLAHANPTWSASELRSELMRIASPEQVDHIVGTSARGSVVTEQRVVNVIRPAMAPACLAQF